MFILLQNSHVRVNLNMRERWEILNGAQGEYENILVLDKGRVRLIKMVTCSSPPHLPHLSGPDMLIVTRSAYTNRCILKRLI
jgi:hypothetical protein